MDYLAEVAEQCDKHGRRDGARGGKIGTPLRHRLLGPKTRLGIMRCADSHPRKRRVSLPPVALREVDW